jgi:hypothetical protein
MTFLKSLGNSLMVVLRKSIAYDIDVIRQNTPPDERDMEFVEGIPPALHQSRTSDRAGKLSHLNILAPVILSMLEILPSAECSCLLASF